jgi:hypothetical protein
MLNNYGEYKLQLCVSTEQIPGSKVTKATEPQRVPKWISLEFRLE